MEIWMMNSQIPADGEAYTDPDMEEGYEDDSSDDSIDPNEELVPIDEAPGMSAGEDDGGIDDTGIKGYI